ncbi:MAG: DedA family protein [Desulfobacterales bacterium]|nr:DedA family protein [Desulfobacterales bacterium]
MDIFLSLGLGGMFLSSFLAATVLPLSSEVVLGLLLAGGYGSGPVVAVATTGNVLGSVVNYWMGLAGSRWLTRKFSRVSAREIARARERFQSWGTASLLLAWVPVVGDPLTVVAGMLRINLFDFILLVTIGKLGRYLVIAGYWIFN